MIHSTSFAQRVQGLFQPTPRGVVGLVDDLLDLCRVHQLRIHYQDGHCFIHPLGNNEQDSLVVPLPKSVFRAILARIAALCNEQHPGSVTPYRGEGEIAVPALDSEKGVSPSTYYVAFTNTPSEQRLEVKFSRSPISDGSQFTA